MGFEKVLGEFYSVLRRQGVAVSVVDALDATRAASSMGFARPDDLRAALRAALVKRADDSASFDRAFSAFFNASGAIQGDFFDHLSSLGLTESEIAALRDMINAATQAGATSFGALGGGSGGFEPWLAAAARASGVEQMQSPMQAGFFTARVLERMNERGMRSELGALESSLRDAFGERADAVLQALTAEIDALRSRARSYVMSEFERRNASIYDDLRRRTLEHKSFTALDPSELAKVEAEVRRFGQKLKGSLAVRRKHQKHGALDVRRTIRRSYRTMGIPFVPVLRRPPRDKPKLVVLCDISDSVRFAARFLLLLVSSIQAAFARTRSFVFVSDLGEATGLFKEHPPERAIALAHSGSVISVASNSNYGNAFGVFCDRYLDALDRRTTVVVLGDGRNNYNDPNERAFSLLSGRAERVLWFNPEPAGSWGFGDSAMPVYEPHCRTVCTVHNLETLREAVDGALLRR